MTTSHLQFRDFRNQNGFWEQVNKYNFPAKHRWKTTQKQLDVMKGFSQVKEAPFWSSSNSESKTTYNWYYLF